MQLARSGIQINKCLNKFRLNNAIPTMVNRYQKCTNFSNEFGTSENDNSLLLKNLTRRFQSDCLRLCHNVDLPLKNFENLSPRPYDVLLELDCVGICKDSEHVDKERLKGLPIENQVIIGHGGSGIVRDIGRYIKNFAIGDRVCFESALPCQNCCYCVFGQHEQCTNFKPASFSSFKDKTLSNYYMVPGNFCHRLLDHVTMEEGALVRPVCIGLRALRNCKIEPGDKVLIVGAGSIGLVTLQLCKAMGSNVLVIDPHQCRLNVANKLNADHTLLIDNEMKTYDIVSKIHKTWRLPPNKAIDCAGMDFTQRLCSYCINSKGRAVSCCFGLLKKNGSPVDTPENSRKHIFIYTREFELALNLVTCGLVNVKILISHHFDKSQINKGVQIVQNCLNGIVKAIVHIQPRNANNCVETL